MTSAAPGAARLLAVLAAGLALPHPVRAQTLAIQGAEVHTLSAAGTLRDGVVLVVGGKIAAVGPAAQVVVPEDCERLSARVVTPGLIDARSSIGLSGLYNVDADKDEDEDTDPNQADLRALDGFNPREPLLRYLLEHGVTAIQAAPAPVNPLAGQAGVFKTHGQGLEAMTVRFPSAAVFTLGEPPKQAYGMRQRLPSTRMGTAAVIRKALAEAQGYERRQRGEAPQAKDARERPIPPERDAKAEALLRALRGEIPTLITAHREDDIYTALRLAREFRLRLILDGATEGYLVARAIREAQVPVLVHPTMQRLDRLETLNSSLENAAILASRGVPIAIESGFEGYVPRTRVVLFEAAIAAANGLGFDRALRAVTIDAARLLEVDRRLGSLEPGKDADLVLFDGDPFEYTSHVEAVVVSGRVAHRRAL